MVGASGGATAPTNPTVGQGSSIDGSSSSSQSNSTSFQDAGSVWGGQAPYLEGLYQQGANTAAASGPQQQQAQDIYGQAQGAYSQMMNPGVNPQLEAYSGQVQQNLERNLLPTIQSEAGRFGQMGGARQGVAEGIAVGDANQQITDMSANLYNDDMDRMNQAMMAAPGLANFGQSIPWYAMQQYKGLLGDPTTLQGAAGSTSTSTSSESSFGSSQSTNEGGGGGGGWDASGYIGW